MYIGMKSTKNIPSTNSDCPNLGYCHSHNTYISCQLLCKCPFHFWHHLQTTVHHLGCCICLPITAWSKAWGGCSRVHRTCEEKQVQKTCSDAVLGIDRHNWMSWGSTWRDLLCKQVESLCFRWVPNFFSFSGWHFKCSSPYIWVRDPWFNAADGSFQR